ncbi:hypothetical protein C8J57DRAFT_1539038 [Mycena rebaudengoi]|nr:hypothetical protein C8J57DRAFT_1539038 [Mycena rebaudengoi]
MPLLLIQYPALCFLPTFSPPQRRAIAGLAALLTRLPDTVLDHRSPQTVGPRTRNCSNTAWVDLDDLQTWLRQRGGLNHLLDPTISERDLPPVGLDPCSLYGMDGTLGDATFDLYPTVNFDQPWSSTPSSGYNFNPYDNYQSLSLQLIPFAHPPLLPFLPTLNHRSHRRLVDLHASGGHLKRTTI